MRIDLVPHLRDDTVLLRGQRNLPSLMHRVRERLLAEDMLAERHCSQRIGACMWSGVDTITASICFPSSSTIRQSLKVLAARIFRRPVRDASRKSRYRTARPLPRPARRHAG